MATDVKIITVSVANTAIGGSPGSRTNDPAGDLADLRSDLLAKIAETPDLSSSFDIVAVFRIPGSNGSIKYEVWVQGS